MTILETDIALGDKVVVKELNRPGRVVGIYLGDTGLQYQVRYFWEGKVESIYFYLDELEKTK